MWPARSRPPNRKGRLPVLATPHPRACRRGKPGGEVGDSAYAPKSRALCPKRWPGPGGGENRADAVCVAGRESWSRFDECRRRGCRNSVVGPPVRRCASVSQVGACRSSSFHLARRPPLRRRAKTTKRAWETTLPLLEWKIPLVAGSYKGLSVFFVSRVGHTPRTCPCLWPFPGMLVRTKRRGRDLECGEARRFHVFFARPLTRRPTKKNPSGDARRTPNRPQRASVLLQTALYEVADGLAASRRRCCAGRAIVSRTCRKRAVSMPMPL